MVEHNKKHDKGNVGHRRGLNQFSDLTSEEFLHRNHGNIKTGLFLPIHHTLNLKFRSVFYFLPTL